MDKKDQCKECKGQKVMKETKIIEVAIEVGVPHEHHETFVGEANEAPGIMAGDLVVRIMIEPHKYFERKGADLYYKKKISLYEALTGTTFQIEHLDGKKINITTAPNEVIQPNSTR